MMLVYKRLFLVALLGLAMSCTFDPDMGSEPYWPCMPDGDCPAGCRCFNDRVCIPDQEGVKVEDCAWCPDGYDNCDTETINGCEARLDDPESCGSCSNVCGDGLLCEIGTCVESCREGFSQCGMTCLDTRTDPENCGECGNACKSGQVCQGGECKGECGEGLRDCNGSCTNIRNDPENCGECGRLCVLLNARPKCELGVCLVDTCLHPFGDCDRQEPGCETDLKITAADCGECGNACGVNMQCMGGKCSCNEHFADCDENPETGCEIMIKTDQMNCGECGNVCDTPPADYCEESHLVVHSRLGLCVEFGCIYEPTSVFCEFGCLDGQCLGDPCNEIVCDEGEVCVNGICSCGATGPDCHSDQTCCGTECVDTWINPEHCGFCFNDCGANAHCTGALCYCDEFWGDCNASFTDGCETYLYESAENCGSCGNSCGQNADCVSSWCACQNGFDNCDGAWDNGCETDLSSPVSCGTCYNACAAGESCCGGICADLSQDDSNCGSCGNGCSTDEICCDGGCANPNESLVHCGRCFNSCVGNYLCDQGSCGKIGVECADGTFCDPFQGQTCCYSSGGNVECSIANECIAHIFDCNGPEDCDMGYVCCAVMESMETTSCMPAQDCPTTTLCTSDLQCLEANPNTPMCCPESIQGVDVFVCMSACP